MGAFDRAVEELYQAPLAGFVAERARLAAALRTAGDKTGATELAKRRRPTASAWTVNRLYRRAREPFDDLLAAAARMRKGDLEETSAYREALGRLRKRAAEELEAAGHRATDAILRRVATTLAAIAAAGGFDPDPPGTLVADRDPPGFEAVGAAAKPIAPAARARDREEARGGRDDVSAARARRAAAAERERAARETRRLAEQARADRRERGRLERAVRAARTQLAKRERALASLQTKLRAAERGVGDVRANVQELEGKLRDLEERR